MQIELDIIAKAFRDNRITHSTDVYDSLAKNCMLDDIMDDILSSFSESDRKAFRHAAGYGKQAKPL